jgi:hypothetical protein
MLHYRPLDSRIENANAMQAFVILAASIVFDTSMVIIYPSITSSSSHTRLQERGSDHHEAGSSAELNTAGSTDECRDGWGGSWRGRRDEAGG